jgi:hypothetical protein
MRQIQFPTVVTYAPHISSIRVLGTLRTEKFIVVLNFSAYDQMLDVPFSDNGTWRELLEGWDVSIGNWRLANHRVGSHWGRIFLLRST